MSVIKVENLGKKYVIGANGAGSDGLRHAIHDLFTNPLRKARNGHSNTNPRSATHNPHSEEFWALKDVSFEVKQGEVVGIIGRNGAGKSTLLKILSRITEPTTGRLGIRGRVASLLEVGTGFHPELTGRENVFLNGAILGMTRDEIKRKFDEIVAFAEIEKFIDTPVKRYSSGMYVRLAFAVAAHLEPNVLIVDEVLAVGDAQFQKKCLGKLGEVAKGGRTVLFVSHNMTAVQTLTHRSLLLEEGLKVAEGPTGDVVTKYLEGNVAKAQEHSWADALSAPGNDEVRLKRARITGEDGKSLGHVTVQTDLVLDFEYWNLAPNARHNLTVHLYSSDGLHILSSASSTGIYPVGLVRAKCRIPSNFLNDGSYRVTLMIVKERSTVVYVHENAIGFEVHDIGRADGWLGKWPGAVRPDLPWEVETVDHARTTLSRVVV